MGLKRGVWKFFSRIAVYSVEVEGGENYSKSAPNIDLYLWRPVISEPYLCKIKELQDGTYSINDLADMHEALDLILKIRKKDASDR